MGRARIFISHGSADEAFVRRIRAFVPPDRQAEWMDSRGQHGENPPWVEIERAIEAAQAYAVVVSPDGLEAEWLGAEVAHALQIQRERGPDRFPVLLFLLDGAGPGVLETLFNKGEQPLPVPVRNTAEDVEKAGRCILAATGGFSSGHRSPSLFPSRPPAPPLLLPSDSVVRNKDKMSRPLPAIFWPSDSMIREAVTSYKITRGTVYPVWFGTNRKPDGRGGFGPEQHDRTTCGRAEVLIPEAHRFGETGSPFWKRLLRFDLRDDRLRLQRLTALERGAWFEEIHGAMRNAEESGEEPHALVFLHGFNVTFQEAAIRAAQIGWDLKVPGATAFFSWPSRGSVTAYPADEATIEASEEAITDFLVDFAANSGAGKVHVIAHSMGNRGLLRSLQRIAGDAGTRGKVRFGQILLAAPDVDRRLFLQLAHLYPEHSERATLYASRHDRPVHLSSKLHAAPRAGYFEPYTVAPGVDTVAVPDFDIDLLGHSYFAQAEALLHDMHDLMRRNTPPGRRLRFAPEVADGREFWRLMR